MRFQSLGDAGANPPASSHHDPQALTPRGSTVGAQLCQALSCTGYEGTSPPQSLRELPGQQERGQGCLQHPGQT